MISVISIYLLSTDLLRQPDQQSMHRHRRKINPAFASAHGLEQHWRRPRLSSNENENRSTETQNKIDAALRAARSTARLNLASCALNVGALPDAIFDLRGTIQIDLNMDSSSNPGAWQSHSEEELTVLDISDNADDLMKENIMLDTRLAKLRSLRTLRSRRSNIATLDWDMISRFDELCVMDLSGNGISVAMLEYIPLTIREVDLSHNKISQLTADSDDADLIIVLPFLVRLDVSNNLLRKLPRSIEVPSLQTLSFGHNMIADLSLPSTDIIMQCQKSLMTLEGQNNNIQAISDLSGCSTLTTIDLGDNNLRKMPSIGYGAIRLSVVNNSLSSIKGIFGSQLDPNSNTSSLVELRLRGNKLSDLDEDILKCLTRVIFIDAGQNDLKDVPAVLGYLPELRKILLDGNPTRAIRTPLLTNTSALKIFLRKRGSPPRGEGYLDEANGDDIMLSNKSLPSSNDAKTIVNSALHGKYMLDLSGKLFRDLPTEIGNALLTSSLLPEQTNKCDFAGERIRQLNVSKNVLNSLDDWLSAMPNVQSLDASKNHIDALPDFIGDIPITDLKISQNRLTSSALARTLTDCIGNAMASFTTYLTHVDISGNFLEWLPSVFSRLPNLSTLILASNSITTLAFETRDGFDSGWPSEGFKTLETLDLSDNKISDLANLPKCLATNCPLVRSLSFANNELSSIPPVLGLLQKVTMIDLRGNPQRGIRMNILERKAYDILSYLKSKIDDEELKAIDLLASTRTSSECKAHASLADEKKTSEQLQQRIQEITLELNNVHLTEVQKCAMKTELQMQKALLIGEGQNLRSRVKHSI